MDAMFQSVSAGITSDYEAAEFLKSALGPQLNASQLNASQQSFFRAVDTISSAYQRRRVLSAVAEIPNISTETLAALLRSASDMTSDYELASLLVHVAERHGLQGELREAYLRAADRIRSSHEPTRVLAALVKSERR
jgi:hypothetical protein